MSRSQDQSILLCASNLFSCILYYFIVEKVLPCSLMSLVPNLPLIGLSSTPFPFWQYYLYSISIVIPSVIVSNLVIQNLTSPNFIHRFLCTLFHLICMEVIPDMNIKISSSFKNGVAPFVWIIIYPHKLPLMKTYIALKLLAW